MPAGGRDLKPEFCLVIVRRVRTTTAHSRMT